MAQLKLKLSKQLRQDVEALLATGYYGKTIPEVLGFLLAQQLKQVVLSEEFRALCKRAKRRSRKGGFHAR